MAKQTRKQNEKRSQNLILIIAAVVIVCVAAVVVVIKPGQSSENEAVSEEAQTVIAEEGQAESEEQSQTISAGENLVIPISEVTEKAAFYPVDVDGTQMEVIAVKDSDGNIRTAFNTCQVCYSSGRGYYEQDGDVLVCQNCGNAFTVDQVEVESGGCNPWPIFEEDKTVTEDSIEISYDFLSKSRDIFANWGKEE